VRAAGDAEGPGGWQQFVERTRSVRTAGCCSAYTFPKNRQHLAALRAVVKCGFTHDMADQFLYDLNRLFPRLEKQQALVLDHATGARFRH